MASDVEEWDPRGRLLDDFGHRVVVQQIGQTHFGVANAVTEGQVARDVKAGRLGSPATPHAPIGKESVTSSAATDDASNATQ